jgi:hypothetical protein
VKTYKTETGAVIPERAIINRLHTIGKTEAEVIKFLGVELATTSGAMIEFLQSLITLQRYFQYTEVNNEQTKR